MSRRGNRGGRQNRKILSLKSSSSGQPFISQTGVSGRNGSSVGSRNNNHLDSDVSISNQVRNHFLQEERRKNVPQERHIYQQPEALYTISQHSSYVDRPQDTVLPVTVGYNQTLPVGLLGNTGRLLPESKPHSPQQYRQEDNKNYNQIYSQGSPGICNWPHKYGSDINVMDGSQTNSQHVPSVLSPSTNTAVYSKILRIYLPCKAQSYHDDSSLEEYMAVHVDRETIDNNGGYSNVNDGADSKYGSSFFYQPQEFSCKFQHNVLHRCNPLMNHLTKESDNRSNKEGDEINDIVGQSNDKSSALMATTFRLKTLKAKELSGIVYPSISGPKSGTHQLRIGTNDVPVTPLMVRSATNNQKSHLSNEYFLEIKKWSELPPNPLIGMHASTTYQSSDKNESKNIQIRGNYDGISDSLTPTTKSTGNDGRCKNDKSNSEQFTDWEKKTDDSKDIEGMSNIKYLEGKEDYQALLDKVGKNSSLTSSFYCDACQKEFEDQTKFDIHNSTAHIRCMVPGCNFTCKKNTRNSDWKMNIHMMTLHRRPNAPDLTNTNAYLADRRKNYPTEEKIKTKIEELYYRSAKGEILPEEKRKWLKRVGGISVKRPPVQLMSKVDTARLPSGTPIFMNGGESLITELYNGKQLNTRESINTEESISNSRRSADGEDQPISRQPTMVAQRHTFATTCGKSVVNSEELNDYKAQILQDTMALQRLAKSNSTEQDISNHDNVCLTPPTSYICTRCSAVGEHWTVFCSSKPERDIDGNLLVTASTGHKRQREDDIVMVSDQYKTDTSAPSAAREAAEAFQKQTKLLLSKKNKLISVMQTASCNTSVLLPKVASNPVSFTQTQEACRITESPQRVSYKTKRDIHINTSTIMIPTLFDRLVYDEKARHNGWLLQAFRYFVHENFFGEQEYNSCYSSERTTTKM